MNALHSKRIYLVPGPSTTDYLCKVNLPMVFFTCQMTFEFTEMVDHPKKRSQFFYIFGFCMKVIAFTFVGSAEIPFEEMMGPKIFTVFTLNSYFF